MISFLILHSESTLELAITTSDVLLLYIFGVGVANNLASEYVQDMDMFILYHQHPL